MLRSKFMLLFAGLTAVTGFGQSLPGPLKAKVESAAKAFQTWSTDSTIVQAVRTYNSAPPAEAAGMTNEKWSALTLLDPTVRSFARNGLATYVKAKKSEAVTEVFISGANGAKVAFLSKPTSWTHQGKDKHQVPMSGKVWLGSVEIDASTGAQQVQVAIPVLDGNKPIGSIVVGFAVAKL
jgi:hypothetical protein